MRQWISGVRERRHRRHRWRRFHHHRQSVPRRHRWRRFHHRRQSVLRRHRRSYRHRSARHRRSYRHRSSPHRASRLHLVRGPRCGPLTRPLGATRWCRPRDRSCQGRPLSFPHFRRHRRGTHPLTLAPDSVPPGLRLQRRARVHDWNGNDASQAGHSPLPHCLPSGWSKARKRGAMRSLPPPD